MIFVGDIACPDKTHSQALLGIFEHYEEIFAGKPKISNLEGMLVQEAPVDADTPVLFNDITVPESLSKAGFVAVGLANNHTLDLPNQFDLTASELSKFGIQFTGAGKTKVEAQREILLDINGKQVTIYNFCWDFLLYHQNNPSNGVHVAILDEQSLLNKIRATRELHPSTNIVVFNHWSFDLESLPFPMYRQFGKDLIDAGASLVIGCHSHCVQGAEKHANGYIVYGLGNFYIPNAYFAKGKLSFPKMSEMELVFEFDHENKTAYCHWFRLENGNTPLLKHIASEQFEDSKILREFSPFQGMDDKEYEIYFKKNRRKKFMVPVFKDYRNQITNMLNCKILSIRGKIAREMAKRGLIKWQN